MHTTPAAVSTWREKSSSSSVVQPPDITVDALKTTEFAIAARMKGREKWREIDSAPSQTTQRAEEKYKISNFAVAAQGKCDKSPSTKAQTPSGGREDVKSTNSMAEAISSNPDLTRISNSPPQPCPRTYRLRYNMKSESSTRNGVPWSRLHRGITVRTIDSGRPFSGTPEPERSDIVNIDGRYRVFKRRFFLIIDQFENHISARPVSTHHGEGLKNQSHAIKRDSLCIFPFDTADQEGWRNEAEPNEIVYLAARRSTKHKLAPTAGVRASQAMMVDREEGFEVVAEVGEEDVRKVEVLYVKLREEWKDVVREKALQADGKAERTSN